MKSERHSFLRSARASHRRLARNGGSTLVESKCQVGVQIMDAVTDQSREPGKAAAAFSYPGERIGDKVATKQPSNAMDPEMLLQFSQQLYAHALTLQEVIRTEGEVAYHVLRPRCDRQAAKQFEIFYRIGDEPTTQD